MQEVSFRTSSRNDFVGIPETQRYHGPCSHHVRCRCTPANDAGRSIATGRIYIPDAWSPGLRMAVRDLSIRIGMGTCGSREPRDLRLQARRANKMTRRHRLTAREEHRATSRRPRRFPEAEHQHTTRFFGFSPDANYFDMEENTVGTMAHAEANILDDGQQLPAT